MSDSLDQFAEYLNRIAQRTRDGEIVWARSSRWVLTTTRQTPSGAKTMLIQRAFSDRMYEDPLDLDTHYDFLFQVVNVQDGQIEVSLDNRRTPELLSTLQGLYEASEHSIGSHSHRVLQELVES